MDCLHRYIQGWKQELIERIYEFQRLLYYPCISLFVNIIPNENPDVFPLYQCDASSERKYSFSKQPFAFYVQLYTLAVIYNEEKH